SIRGFSTEITWRSTRFRMPAAITRASSYPLRRPSSPREADTTCVAPSFAGAAASATGDVLALLDDRNGVAAQLAGAGVEHHFGSILRQIDPAHLVRLV